MLSITSKSHLLNLVEITQVDVVNFRVIWAIRLILSAVNPDTLYIVKNDFENGTSSRMEIVMVVGG